MRFNSDAGDVLVRAIRLKIQRLSNKVRELESTVPNVEDSSDDGERRREQFNTRQAEDYGIGLQMQQQQQRQHIEEYKERQQNFAQLEQDIQDVNSIFSDLASIVHKMFMWRREPLSFAKQFTTKRRRGKRRAMESRLLSLLETEPYGVDVDKMIGRLGAFASDEQAAFNVALNALVADGLLEIVQFGYNFRAKVKAIEPPGPAGLTLEESVLNSLVIDAGNKGISITKLREQTGLWQPPMRTALKSLEQKKLIKAVKSVATTREWCYMPYDAVEDASFTGGTFCSDRQLDDELDKVYSDFRRYKNLTSSKGARQVDKELAKTPIDVVTID